MSDKVSYVTSASCWRCLSMFSFSFVNSTIWEFIELSVEWNAIPFRIFGAELVACRSSFCSISQGSVRF